MQILFWQSCSVRPSVVLSIALHCFTPSLASEYVRQYEKSSAFEMETRGYNEGLKCCPPASPARPSVNRGQGVVTMETGLKLYPKGRVSAWVIWTRFELTCKLLRISMATDLLTPDQNLNNLQQTRVKRSICRGKDRRTDRRMLWLQVNGFNKTFYNELWFWLLLFDLKANK